ncbi:hypothetical protein TGME49_248425 [Toxoplasma gondii ME49]|uniref:Secreted protein n=3 Tax=Toxoplasma gondii TaxID=5811 RepID=A0A125YFQ4_TOXGV|nr:hypothetical protein TGME49_248425 [Toxoplasma gondii ME49]EPT25006.1 hypothetical protein TGME49_248425 [Toxoplasma gondii ME49]ESS34286.1 hypothetical protein TGVEG_248425 [Toxoplasma gondii VEG]KYF49695.1 hypothetical protein TGARI_248425 [Toxoplasma gondii ARI]|eukprot:XP_018634998.1 hypothetical protein TGME49_248425 [Toxoplasma gondii ME49]
MGSGWASKQPLLLLAPTSFIVMLSRSNPMCLILSERTEKSGSQPNCLLHSSAGKTTLRERQTTWNNKGIFGNRTQFLNGVDKHWTRMTDITSRRYSRKHGLERILLELLRGSSTHFKTTRTATYYRSRLSSRENTIGRSKPNSPQRSCVCLACREAHEELLCHSPCRRFNARSLRIPC